MNNCGYKALYHEVPICCMIGSHFYKIWLLLYCFNIQITINFTQKDKYYIMDLWLFCLYFLLEWYKPVDYYKFIFNNTFLMFSTKIKRLDDHCTLVYFELKFGFIIVAVDSFFVLCRIKKLHNLKGPLHLNNIFSLLPHNITMEFPNKILVRGFIFNWLLCTSFIAPHRFFQFYSQVSSSM